MEAFKTGTIDVGFVAIDPERAGDVSYSAPYVIIEGAYLVTVDSPIRSNADVDRAGTRVAVGARSAYDLYLSRELKHATIVRAPTSPEVVDFFVARKLDVAAGVKQQLEADARRLPGLRLLDGRFMVINQAMATAARTRRRTRVPDRVRRDDEVVRLRRGGLGEARHRRRGGGAVTRRSRTPSRRPRSCLHRVASRASAAHAASPPPVAARNGMVATSQHLATKVGVDILKQGGNAVDAAVAVGYALGVVLPAAGNIGGGGFMTIQLADGRSDVHRLPRNRSARGDRRTCTSTATATSCAARSTKGYLAAAVPGNVAGFELALAKYGTMKRAAVMAPAIRLAKERVRADARRRRPDRDRRRAICARTRRPRRSSCATASPMRAGQRLVQKDLARTLERIATHGNAGFYAGPVADAIVAASARGDGIISKADLARYRGQGAHADRVRLSRLHDRLARRRRARAG